ncbi:MAG: glycosyltransferase family 4 protein [Bacillota bacterium]
MKIGLDVNPLVTGHRFRGIGSYVKNLCRSLIESGTSHRFYLYYGSGLLNVSAPGNVTIHCTRAEKKDLLQLTLEDGVEVFHITDFYHPVYTVPDLVKLKQRGVKLVVSVADAIPLRFPDLYPAEKTFLLKNLAPLLSLSNRVIAISRATADDFIKFFSLPPSRISVTHLGVDTNLFSPRHEESDGAVLQKYAITAPYFLYVGGLDWRKNCDTLLRAFSAFLAKEPGRHQLVLVGNDPPGPAMAETMGTLPEKPVITGFVPEQDLPPLYRHATALVFPSRFEGFGLPLVEALACGTPVISSDRGSLPEIAGGGGLLLDPDDIESWAEKMYRVATTPSLREALRAGGVSRVPLFSWVECARKTMEVYLSPH